jgi:hypothetical protein
MNIFALDYEQELCAQYHCDKHVVKMIVEYAQLLSTAHRILDGEMKVVEYVTKTGKARKKKVYVLPDVREQILYKATHANHPSAVWARKSLRNYQWLSCLLGWLCKEYTRRYGKVHRVEASGLMDRLYKHPKYFNKAGALIDMTTIPQAMPEQFQREDVVDAYRAFYTGSKARFAKWVKLNNTPEWFKPDLK